MKIRLATVFIVFVTLCIGCKKDESHYVRIRNLYTEKMEEVKLDAINYGKIDTGAVTEYKYVLEGTFPISIISESGQKATGTAFIKGGSGRHNWTITISKAGTVDFAEDK
jgi:hypothetical protein